MGYISNKKIIISILTIFILSIFLSPNLHRAHAEGPNLDLSAKAAILIDANSGKILFEHNAEQALPIASMSKMMTEYLVLDAIKEGKISWDTKTKISQYVYNISKPSNGFSGVGLQMNLDYTVNDLYKLMAVYSDNAATIALAELIAGSEDNFVNMMNKKAKELGLPDAHFVNCTGLSNTDLVKFKPNIQEPNAENELSAKSVALLAYSLLKVHPEILETTSIATMTFQGKQIYNWNYMLPNSHGYLQKYSYDGVDGLKTGWTQQAGPCFTGTAKRDGMRLISVVMNVSGPNKEARFEATRKLFDYGFNNFEEVNLYPNGYQQKGNKTIPVIKGKDKTVEIATDKPIKMVIKKDENKKGYKLKYVFDKKALTAPVKKGEKVGYVTVTNKSGNEFGFIASNSKDNATANLVTTNNVEKANWFVLTLRGIGGFFGDVWNSITGAIKGIF